MNNSERDALSLSLTSGSQAAQDACKSAQADKKAALLKASSMTPGGFRSLSAKITPWRPDLTKCHVCEAKFTLFNHRHSCRKCQEPVCNQCSRARKVLRRYAPPKRVCDPCVDHFWAIKTREPDAAAAGAAANKSSSDTSKTGGDPRLSLTVSAPSSSALAGGMYASHTASLSPGTPAAAFFGPNTTDMNRGRRRLGSTSVESCLSLGTPSMLPPPTPAGGEGDAAVAPPPPHQEEQALSSPVIMKEEESGTFFGGRRESCGGGKGGAATPASLVVQDMGDFKSEMAAAGEAVTAAVLAADPEAAAEAASSSVSASREKNEVKAKMVGVEATPSSPRGVVVASKEEEVKNAVVVVVEAGQNSTSTVDFVRRASLEGVSDGGVEESKSGTPEDLLRSGETNMTEADKGARRSSSDGEIRPVSPVQAEKKSPPAEKKLSVEVILHENDAGKTEEQVKAELESEVAPVASVAESLVGSVAGSVAGDDELDDIEDVVDDKFVMPTVSAAASALAEAVSAAATAALLPAVLEEEPAPESVAAAAAAAVAVLVEAKNKGAGGEKVMAPADVAVDKVAKDDAGDGKEDGGGSRGMGMKTLACCGAVAFGVGLVVAVIVRAKW